MDNLYEDLHWLLLISGYLLADESNGETPLIPQEIISYSSSLKAQVDIQTTFQTLCASQSQNQGKCCGGICFTTLLNQRVKILENSVCRVIIFQPEENSNCSQPFVLSSHEHLSSQVHRHKKGGASCASYPFLSKTSAIFFLLIFQRITDCKQNMKKNLS